MSGKWACDACASAAGHVTGHGYSVGGWCGVGRHSVKERIRWYPTAREAKEIVAETVPVTTPEAKVQPVAFAPPARLLTGSEPVQGELW